MNKKKLIVILFTILSVLFTACGELDAFSQSTQLLAVVSVESIPEYSGEPYIVINNNEPNFNDSDMTTNSFESYSDLDSLGRCGVAFANVGKDIMPTEERGSISHVKPTGWHSVKYDNVDGNICIIAVI